MKEKHFIIHQKDSQDQVFYGDNIIEVLEALKYVYFQNFGKNLPVYELPENEQINKYAKTFKDVEKGKSVMPD